MGKGNRLINISETSEFVSHCYFKIVTFIYAYQILEAGETVMSFLEERITKILERRLLGHDDQKISEALDLLRSEILNCEEMVKKEIKKSIEKGKVNLNEIANEVGLSPITVYSAAFYYKIKIPEYHKRLTLETRFNQIRKAIDDGADSVEAIAEKVPLKPNSIKSYAMMGGIILPEAKTARSKRKQILNDIISAREEMSGNDKIPYAEAIADKLGVSIYKVKYYCRCDNICLPKKPRKWHPTEKRRRIEERFQQIIEAKEVIEKEGGIPYASIIAKKIGLAEATVVNYGCKGSISLPHEGKGHPTPYTIYTRKRLSKDEKLKAIQTALEEGVKSLEEICKRTRLKPSGLRIFCDDNSIQLPSDLIPYRYKPKMDVVIDRESTLEEIGIAGGYPAKSAREVARQYILDSGQYVYRIKRQEEVTLAKKIELEQKKHLNERRVYILKAWITERTKKESWAYQKAIEYFMSHRFIKGISYEPKILIKLFQRYEKARNANRKISLEELGKSLGLYTSHVGKIFSAVGVEPLYGNLPRQSKQFYSKQRSFIPKMINMGMNYNDISYFLDISPPTTQKTGIKTRAKKYIVQIGFRGGVLSYRLASKIYGAQGAGFKKYSDIAELFNTTPEIVKYAIAHKQRIAPKLVKVFRMAYDDPKYDKPYKKGLKV